MSLVSVKALKLGFNPGQYRFEGRSQVFRLIASSLGHIRPSTAAAATLFSNQIGQVTRANTLGFSPGNPGDN